MRRQRRQVGSVPAHLLTFNDADWPGRSWAARYAQWCEAMEAHAAANDWPGGPLDRFYRRMHARLNHLGVPIWEPVARHLRL